MPPATAQAAITALTRPLWFWDLAPELDDEVDEGDDDEVALEFWTKPPEYASLDDEVEAPFVFLDGSCALVAFVLTEVEV